MTKQMEQLLLDIRDELGKIRQFWDLPKSHKQELGKLQDRINDKLYPDLKKKV